MWALAFAALVATNAGLVLVNRSESRSLLAAFRQHNPALWWMLGATSAILGCHLADCAGATSLRVRAAA